MKPKIPNTDSIQELAEFWEQHDLTDFEDDLEQVTECVFERKGAVLQIPLTSEQAHALEALAQSRGLNSISLIQEWIQQNT